MKFESLEAGLMLLSFLWVMLRKSAAHPSCVRFLLCDDLEECVICWGWWWSLCRVWFEVGMENEEHFIILPAHKLYGDADFFFQQSLAGVRSSKTKGNSFLVTLNATENLRKSLHPKLQFTITRTSVTPQQLWAFLLRAIVVFLIRFYCIFFQFFTLLYVFSVGFMCFSKYW